MKDKKHLSQDRVNNFAKNLKAAFFNTKPRNGKRKPIRKSEQFDKNQRELPTRRNPKLMFNKYNPEPRLPTSFKVLHDVLTKKLPGEVMFRGY